MYKYNVTKLHLLVPTISWCSLPLPLNYATIQKSWAKYSEWCFLYNMVFLGFRIFHSEEMDHPILNTRISTPPLIVSSGSGDPPPWNFKQGGLENFCQRLIALNIKNNWIFCYQNTFLNKRKEIFWDINFF